MSTTMNNNFNKNNLNSSYENNNIKKTEILSNSKENSINSEDDKKNTKIVSKKLNKNNRKFFTDDNNEVNDNNNENLKKELLKKENQKKIKVNEDDDNKSQKSDQKSESSVSSSHSQKSESSKSQKSQSKKSQSTDSSAIMDERDKKLLNLLIDKNSQKANEEQINYVISMFFNQLGNVVDEVCADKNINSFVVQRVKLYLFLKLVYKLFFNDFFVSLRSEGIIKEHVVLGYAIRILGGNKFSNLFLEEFVEDFPGLNQRFASEVGALEDNAEIVKEVIKKGVPLGSETDRLKILSMKLACLTETPQFSNRLNRLENKATTGFELKDLDYNILPYSLNFASIYNEINRKADDFFNKVGFLSNFKDFRAIQLFDVLKTTKSEILRKMSSLSNVRDSKIKEIFAEKGGRFGKLLKEEFAEEKASIKATASEFSDLNSLISSIRSEKNKFENLSKDLKKRSEDFGFSKNDVVLRKEMFVYVSKMQNLMKNAEEVLADMQKDADFSRTGDFNLTFNVEKFRNGKITYGKKLAQFFDFLVKRKYEKEIKTVEVLNNLNVDIDLRALEQAYNEFIIAMINKKGLVTLDEIKRCCKAIGYELNEWNILNYAPQEGLLRAARGNELKKLNQQLAELLNKLNNSKGALIGNIIKLFRERAASDLMTIYSMRNMIQPMVDILGFNFLNMKSRKDFEKLKFELKDVRRNNVKDTLINFIETFLELNNGKETFEGMSWNRNGFYLDFQDRGLRGAVKYLRNLISSYGGVNLESLFEKNTTKEDEDVDEEEKEQEEIPVSSTDKEEEKKGNNEIKVRATELDNFLEDGSKNGYIVPLMGTEKHAIQNAQCEYKYESDCSVLLFLKGVSAKPNCGIIAVPLCEGKEGAHVRLSDNVGLIPFLVKSSMNEVHFYYSKPDDLSTDVDPQAFIGSVRLTYLDKTTAREGTFPKKLKIHYETDDKNVDRNAISVGIYDYSDKIIFHYEAPFYPGNVLFIATNKDVDPVERMRYSIVESKNGYIAVVFDDLQMLNKLGDKFEVHMYNGELIKEKFLVKLLIDRNDVVPPGTEEKKDEKEEKIEKKVPEKKKERKNKKEEVREDDAKTNNKFNLLNMRMFDDEFDEEDLDFDLDYDF